MNDFTKEELEYINDYIFNGAACIRFDNHENLKNKIQSMINNYSEDVWNRNKIAESHLQEASSLISHAMCLLEMIEDYCEHKKVQNIGGWVSKCVKCGMKFGDETQ